MKNILIIIGIIVAFSSASYAQNVNWRALNEQNSIASFNLGYDFGVTAQLGYNRSIKAFKPILLGGDFSFPAGEDFMDDFKVRLGGQIEVFESNGFSVTGKIFASFRRHETDLVRMASFGSEFSLVSGYYKPTWHIAAELGFDKSIVTNLKHSEIIREYVYADIQDGWFIPSGGNWFYGIQGSKTVGKSMEISSRLGATNAQGNDEDAIIPFYFHLGINKKF